MTSSTTQETHGNHSSLADAMDVDVMGSLSAATSSSHKDPDYSVGFGSNAEDVAAILSPMSSETLSAEARRAKPQILAPEVPIQTHRPANELNSNLTETVDDDMGPVSEDIGTPQEPQAHCSDRARTEQRRRIALVARYRDLIGQLPSRAAAAAAMRRAGYTDSRANLDRYLAAHDTGGDAALIPAWGNCGRDPKCALTEHEALILRGIILARSTVSAIHFSLSVEEFRHHASCLPLTRIYIEHELDRAAQRRRLPAWPPSWRKAAMPTKQEIAKFHGPKHLIEIETVDRRGMFFVDLDGRQINIGPHTIWEMDDASDNAPRVTVDPETGRTSLTRKTLWTQDLYSGSLLGFSSVGRERDAYRIEDVADHTGNSIRAHGLPEILRLEMGKIWNGRFFHGFVPDIAGWPDGEKWGGLDPVVKIVNVYKSKGKGAMENSFNLIQAMAAHAALDIGRTRGDYEDATKQLTAAHRTGQPDARFWDMLRSDEHKVKIAEWFNSRPKQRIAFGKDLVCPNDLLRGARGRAMSEDQWWRLCPVKKEATVRGDHVEVSVDHYPNAFRFRVNGVKQDLHLDHGYRVLIAFHPGRPEEGCHIFNAELGSRNRDGFRRAEYILAAPISTLKPQVDLSGRADFGPRKMSSAAVTRSYRAIGKAFQASHRQTGTGLILRSESGAATTSDPTTPTATPSLRLAPRPRWNVPENPEQSLARAMKPSTQEEFKASSSRMARLAKAMAGAEE